MVNIFLSWRKASSALSFHSKKLVLFMSWYKGRAFSPSRLMKRLMDAKQPVNFCTSSSQVGTSILSMALIFTGLHSMPRSETRKPRS